MNIFVTGATGFVGSNLLKELGKYDDFNVKVLVREGSLNKISGVPQEGKVVGDILSSDDLHEVLGRTDVIIHAAAATSPLPDRIVWQVNVRGTERLVEAAKKAGVRKFIFISTASVLSSHLGAYERSKLEAEEIVRKSGLHYIILRPTLVYGKGDIKNIGRMIRLARTMPVVPIIGNGKTLMQPVYIGDLMKVVKTLLDRDDWPQRAYSLAGKDRISLKDCYKKICGCLHINKVFFHIPYWLATSIFFTLQLMGIRVISPVQIHHLKEGFVYDIRPAVLDLGFSPISFEKGLRQLFDELG